jgi:Zn-finger nucleic acid-binding protein
MQCPKCYGTMRTYNRSGIQIEQCDNCKGIFLDYGELEHINQLENQWTQQVAPPPQQGYAQPSWGHHGHHHHKRGGFGKLFFSS